MKKIKLIGIMLLTCIVTVCIALFAGCGCNEDNLDTPEGFSYSSGTFSWNAVDGADGYMVHVNEEDEFYITETSVSINDEKISGGLIDKKVNTLFVKAVTVDGEGNVNVSSETASYEFDYVNTVKQNWTVTFDFNYSGSPQAQTVPVAAGEKVIKPENPQRPGWTFGGWFRDKQCLVAASFNASTGASNFAVTANMTLYAKWSVDSSVTTTAVYFYSESWEQVSVKPYKGETQLFAGEGIAMAAVAGNDNWFKANIDDTATSVIFTNGEDSTESEAFDKTKPYYKDGEWTATMPTEQPEIPTLGVNISVNNGTFQQLTENSKVPGEFMIDLNLEVGDTVVITIDGETVSNYDPDCKFNGTATAQGKHSFYVTADRIWVEAPKGSIPDDGSNIVLIVNGNTENAEKLAKHDNSDPRVEAEYTVTLQLNKGDTVKIMEDSDEYSNYEVACGFNGTATVSGVYTFYVKKMKDGGNSIWVTVPEDFVAETVKIYYHNSGWVDNWSSPTAYCWNGSGNNGWPGKAMTDLGDGWFVVEVEAGYENVIFVGADGNQTGDLKLVVVDGVAYYNYNGVTELRPAE